MGNFHHLQYCMTNILLTESTKVAKFASLIFVISLNTKKFQLTNISQFLLHTNTHTITVAVYIIADYIPSAHKTPAIRDLGQ